MKRLITLFTALIYLPALYAQEVDPDLIQLRDRLDSITRIETTLRMEVDISFVTMPVKQAELVFEKGKPLDVISGDFLMIPKRGLDLTLSGLFAHPFMSLNMGPVRVEGRECELIKLIPSTEQSDFSIATIWLDRQALQIVKSQISTKKNGVFDIAYTYSGADAPLPSEILVEFEVSEINIPLRFLGKDTQVDRSRKKSSEGERGAIVLSLSNYRLTWM